jgi:hypothetical protein
MSQQHFLEGQEKVLNAIREFIENGGELNKETLDEFAEEFEPKPNHYLSYSLDTLRQLAHDYAFKIGGGRTKLANGEILGEAYQQVLEAIEERERTDYCKHGVFKWTDYDIPCAACEFAD